MSIVRKMLPCPLYDIAKLETWFKDCAAKGLFLKENGIGRLSAQFETGEPEVMTYRFEPSAYILEVDEILDENNRKDKIAFLEEAGWKLTAQCRQYFVFAHEGNSELHTDPETESVIRMDLARARFVQLLRACVPLAYFGMLLFSSYMRFMIQTGSWIVLLTIPFVLISFIGSVIESVRLFVQASKMEQGQPFRHEKDWRKTASLYRIFEIMKFFMYGLMAAALLAMVSDVGAAGRISLKDYDEDPPFMTVADIDPDAEYVMNDLHVESLRRQFPTLNTMRHYSDIFSKDNYTWTEDAYLKQEGGALDVLIDLNYHDTQYNFVAERLYKEYCGNNADPAFAQKYSGCDQCAGTEDENGLIILFVFQKGNKVVSGRLSACYAPAEYVTSEILQKLIDSVNP